MLLGIQWILLCINVHALHTYNANSAEISDPIIPAAPMTATSSTFNPLSSCIVRSSLQACWKVIWFSRNLNLFSSSFLFFLLFRPFSPILSTSF